MLFILISRCSNIVLATYVDMWKQDREENRLNDDGHFRKSMPRNSPIKKSIAGKPDKKLILRKINRSIMFFEKIVNRLFLVK